MKKDMKKYITLNNVYGIKTIRMVNQPEIIAYLKENPCKTEAEIFEGVYGFVRGGFYSNKKYADCLRRALYSGKVGRVKIKFKDNRDTRFLYRYFAVEGLN
jgi:hypothetical protein